MTLLMLVQLTGKAQLNPQGSGYYLNPYLANPAFAGTEAGWHLTGAITAQLTQFHGAPFMQAVTLSYGSQQGRVGSGLILYQERAGVISRMVAKATYAYHIPLDYEDRNLDLGLSGGMMKDRIELNKVTGDQDDPALADFNERGSYFDGDFGFAYRTPVLTLQGSIPNLKRFLNPEFREVADRYLYMGAVSYRLTTYWEKQASFTPMVMYRVVQHYKNIWDVGLQAELEQGKLTASAIYHSTGSVTAGIGTVHQHRLSILCQFTTSTADLASYSSGQFEIAAKYKL